MGRSGQARAGAAGQSLDLRLRSRASRPLPPGMTQAPLPAAKTLTLADLEIWDAFTVEDGSVPDRFRLIARISAITIQCRNLETGKLRIFHPTTEVAPVEAKPLEGETVVITGEIPAYTPRTAAWSAVWSAGAEYEDTIRKSTTTIVVAGFGSIGRSGRETTKLEKARRWGIPVVHVKSAADFQHLLEHGLAGLISS